MSQASKQASSESSESTKSTESVYESTTSIQDLPNEILVHIFSHFDFVQRVRLKAVCRRWDQLIDYPIRLLLDPIFFPNHKFTDKVLICILSICGTNVRELTLKRNSKLTNESLDKVGEFCPHLVVIELHLVGFQVHCLKEIADNCPNLKTARLLTLMNAPTGEGYHLFNSDYTDSYNEGLLSFAQSCKQLVSLCVAELKRVELRVLYLLNPDLHTLCLYDTFFIESDGMRCLITRFDALEELAMGDCFWLDEGIVFELLSHFRHSLKALSVDFQGGSDLEWREGLQVLQKLEMLQFIRSDIMDDGLMKVLAGNCTQLQSLDIGDSRVSDVGLITLTSLPKLKRLRIRQIYRRPSCIRGHGLEVLVAKGILQKVTIPANDEGLHDACRNIATMWPNVRFVRKQW